MADVAGSQENGPEQGAHVADLTPMWQAMRQALDLLDPHTALVARYHLGFADEHGRPAEGNSGKAVRAALALLSAQAAGAAAEVGLPGAVAVELLHNSSLVHDDLLDRDPTRRHRPTVWTVWDETTAVLTGDALLGLAQEVVLAAPHGASAGLLLASATRALIRGQVDDIAFESRDLVTLDECLAMVADKTGALLAASAAIGAVLAGADPALVGALQRYGAEIGVAFQLVDDVLGVWGDPVVTGKPVFSDLASRKKSLVMCWTTGSAGAPARQVADWLTDPAGADRDLAHIAELMERAGAREWALREAASRLDAAERALASAPIPPEVLRRLRELGRSLARRRS